MLMIRFLIVFVLCSGAYAQDNKKGFDVFTPGQIRKMLGDFPAEGSPAFEEDFNTLLRFQTVRTEEECAEARLEEEANLGALFAGPKGPLTKEEAKKISLRILPVYAEAGANIWIAKNVYKRPRPYLVNTDLEPCIDRESSYAYPSGHSALARTFAHVLSAFWPERREAFFQRADEVALNRVLGGVHHPSDVEAGKILGDAIAKKVLRTLELNETHTRSSRPYRVFICLRDRFLRSTRQR